MKKICAIIVLFAVLTGCSDDLGVVYYEPSDGAIFREDGTIEFTGDGSNTFAARPIIYCRMKRSELSEALSRKEKVQPREGGIEWRSLIQDKSRSDRILLGEDQAGNFFALHLDGIYGIRSEAVDPIRKKMKECKRDLRVTLE